MALETPNWWYRRHGRGAPWWWPVLWPLTLVWRLGELLRRTTTAPFRAQCRVISVGNLTAGGSGKTPIVREILRLLSQAGLKAAGLSRGYGGRLSGPLMANGHSAAEVGDEAALIAQDYPMAIARKRAEGLALLNKNGVEFAVLDDGHQNPSICKDVSLLVIDGDVSSGAWPFGNGGLIPYGPLREPMDTGLQRAEAVIFWMKDTTTPVDADLLAFVEARLKHGTPILIARLEANAPPLSGPVIAWCGIAKPWKFMDTLMASGMEPIDFVPLADHEALEPSRLSALRARAQATGVPLITTEKDWIKLPEAERVGVHTLPIRARFEDEAALMRLLRGLKQL